MNFGDRGAFTLPVLPNTPLPPAGFPLFGLADSRLSTPQLNRNSCLSVSELSEHTGICQRTLREKIKANEFRWHRVGNRVFIVWGEFLEDTELRQ